MRWKRNETGLKWFHEAETAEKTAMNGLPKSPRNRVKRQENQSSALELEKSDGRQMDAGAFPEAVRCYTDA